jgi:hypothetical protein
MLASPPKCNPIAKEQTGRQNAFRSPKIQHHFGTTFTLDTPISALPPHLLLDFWHHSTFSDHIAGRGLGVFWAIECGLADRMDIVRLTPFPTPTRF